MDEEWRMVVNGQWLRDCMEEWRDWGHLVKRGEVDHGQSDDPC